MRTTRQQSGVAAGPTGRGDRGAWATLLLARAVPVLLLVLCPGAAAYAQTSVSIITISRALAPAQTDYETGYVESLSPVGGVRVRVTTAAPAGLILYVSCGTASPPIALADLLIKCPTAGSLISSFTAISASDQALWATSSPVTDQDVDTDVRVTDLWDYPDAGSAGTTSYTNTLTYTVVEQ